MKLFIAISLTLCTTAIFAQRKTLHGFMLTYQYTSDQLRKTGVVEGHTGGWRAGYLLDISLTSRLSLQVQPAIQVMSPRQFLNQDNQRLLYPEIVAGFVEYLPTGPGAAYLGLDLHAGYGFGTADYANQQNINVFDQPGFNRIRSGFGAQAGFIFNNGIMIQSNFRWSAFGNFYNQHGLRYYHNTAGVGMGLLLNYRQRSQTMRRFY